MNIFLSASDLQMKICDRYEPSLKRHGGAIVSLRWVQVAVGDLGVGLQMDSHYNGKMQPLRIPFLGRRICLIHDWRAMINSKVHAYSSLSSC